MVKLMRKILHSVLSQQTLASIILILWMIVLGVVIFQYYQAEEYSDINNNGTDVSMQSTNYLNTIDDLTASYYGIVFESSVSVTPITGDQDDTSDDQHM